MPEEKPASQRFFRPRYSQTLPGRHRRGYRGQEGLWPRCRVAWTDTGKLACKTISPQDCGGDRDDHQHLADQKNHFVTLCLGFRNKSTWDIAPPEAQNNPSAQ